MLFETSQVERSTNRLVGSSNSAGNSDSNFAVSLYSVSSRHPLNVRPSGNSILQSDDSFVRSRQDNLGKLARFPDDLIMTLLSYIDDRKDLHRLSLTSRFLYAFLYDEEIWRKLCTKEVHQESEEETMTTWRGSWRCTVLHLDEKAECKLQLVDNELCSDILYRPFQCSNIDYDKLFHKLSLDESKQPNITSYDSVPSGRLARIQESYLTIPEFNLNWHDKPFILTNDSASRWPRWDLKSLLERFPNVRFRQESVQWPLSLYGEYLQNNKDENPLYLFDCSSVAMKELQKEYTAPEIFQQDLFRVFDSKDSSNCRPDHAWLIVGPKRSGSTFHKDPNYTSAWNTALTGRKLWIMLPGDITPPGVGTDDEESEVTSPVGIAEWVISGFFNDSIKIPECKIGITFPGECMYVPSGWWHSVINLDDSVALTQNFVPPPKLHNALNFFKNKGDQISGFKPKYVNNTIKDLLSNGIEDPTSKLYEFTKEFQKLPLELQNEDCGEISSLPSMPIFELFSELMKQNGKEDELNEGLKKLNKLEKANNGPGKSEAWEKIQLEKSNGFSFGFESEDEDDDLVEDNNEN
ncbi:hypothetical protein CLIB1423_06S03422 [[Candida] railenensis]|uniref:JmjC domain-containing protein n=1 Tax=[Candida] railenensis TaxID=45579 RepID=A0A9P0QP53_9ASCO|nr:hypothetical protein CLIB1423_06S03422 [[Candida] railenensis]